MKDLFNKSEDLSMGEINQITEIIKNAGALDFAELYSKNLITQAKQKMEKIYPGLRVESEEFFNGLLDFSLI